MTESRGKNVGNNPPRAVFIDAHISEFVDNAVCRHGARMREHACIIDLSQELKFTLRLALGVD